MVPGFVKTLMHENQMTSKVYAFLKGRYMHWLNRGNRRLLQREGGRILKHIHDVLSERGILYFANYGTLLGVVRDGHYVKNDDDIDLSIPPNTSMPRQLLEAFEGDPDVCFCNAFKWCNRITGMTFSARGLPVDFFFQYVENGVNYSHWYDPVDGKWSAENGGRFAFRRPIPIPVNIHDVEFEGGIVPIPDNADEILASAYGDWRTPMDKNSRTDYEDVRPAKTLLPDFGWVITDKGEIL